MWRAGELAPALQPAERVEFRLRRLFGPAARFFRHFRQDSSPLQSYARRPRAAARESITGLPGKAGDTLEESASILRVIRRTTLRACELPAEVPHPERKGDEKYAKDDGIHPNQPNQGESARARMRHKDDAEHDRDEAAEDQHPLTG